MSKTLARKIRRIGILPSTYTEMTETRLVKDDKGKETTQQVTIHKPVRNREKLSIEELITKREALVSEWRMQRKRAK
jgi:hypothetical protein